MISEQELVDRFIEKYKGKVHYCPDTDSWFVWDGTRHKQTRDEAVIDGLMQEVIVEAADEERRQCNGRF